VIVVMENRSFDDVIGQPDAPYINALAGQGALFTRSFGVTHPSEPNYLALFSGSTHGVTRDSCPLQYSGPSLGGQLIDAGLGFIGYSEGLPSVGFTGCSYGSYARKHAPWVNFTDVPPAANQPFSAFPADPSSLPPLAFVMPDLGHDMHDGTVAQADSWLLQNLGGYVRWAQTHRSLLVLTWDEDDGSADNRIPTIIVGAGVVPGRYDEDLTHYRLLRTLQDMFGLAPLGDSAAVPPVTDIWVR
jgi:acid phosphatase